MSPPRPAKRSPDAHPSGARPPSLPPGSLPGHVAIVMDGNGRWAKARGLPRTAGHQAGEAVLMDVIAGAIEIGLRQLSVYAFSTENWKRSPEEVRFLMGYSRDVIHRRRDELDAWGVRVLWAGRRPRLWQSVINELEAAAAQTRDNSGIDLQFCINYGGRAEIVDAARELARATAQGRLTPDRISEKTLAARLYQPAVGDVDLFLRTSGEQRLSNFLLWQAAYAELVFLDKPWPEIDRRDLWAAVEAYSTRERRFGTA